VNSENTMLDGRVKFFNFSKGYGFIEHNQKDYFVHVTDLVDGDLLLEGEEVVFKGVEGHKVHQAIEVSRKSPPALDDEMGTVKFFHEDKGYGFIERSGKADVFAHFTDIVTPEHEHLRKGQQVRFQVRSGRDGRDRAYKISIVG